MHYQELPGSVACSSWGPRPPRFADEDAWGGSRKKRYQLPGDNSLPLRLLRTPTLPPLRDLEPVEALLAEYLFEPRARLVFRRRELRVRRRPQLFGLEGTCQRPCVVRN